MFEAAVAAADCSDEKNVTRHRRRFAEEADLPFADALEVAAQAAHVAIVATGNHDLMWNATGLKGGVAEAAHFDRVVDQFVVVFGAVQAEAVAPGFAALVAGGLNWIHRRGDAPVLVAFACRRLDIDVARRLFLPDHAQEDAGAVEEGVRLVKVRAAHREIPGVDLDDDSQRRRVLQRRRLPGVLVELLQRDRLAACFGANRHDVAGEVADQVAAGNPCRQRETLPDRIGQIDGAAHFEAMCGGMGWQDGV